MRYRSASVAIVGAFATASCLSETLMDNYRDGGAEDNSAGAPADLDQLPGLGGTFSFPNGGLKPAVGVNSGFVSSQSSEEPAGGTSGSEPHRSSGYQSTGFWQAGAVTPIHFGVTEREHVVVLSEVPADDSRESWLLLSELASTGTVLRNLELRSGAMPELFRLLSDGSMVFAGKLDRDLNFGRTSLGKLEQGYYVVKLDAEWNEAFAFAKSTPHAVTLQDIAVGRDGSMYLASDESGITALDSSGSVLRELKGVLGARLAIDQARNTLLVAGWFREGVALGATSLVSRGARDGVVFSCDESSLAVSSVWQFGGIDDDEATSVAIANNGEPVIGGRVGRQESLFGATLETNARGAAFVAQVDASGHGRWMRHLGEGGRVSHVVTQGASTYVAAYAKPSTETSSTMRLSVTQLSETGQQAAFFAFDGQLNGHGQLGLASSGVVWLSAIGQIRMEGWSEPQRVSAIYRMAPAN